jgi:hypothetical protein
VNKLFFSSKVVDWIKILATAVKFSWYHNYERSIVVDEDREKIDTMIADLHDQAFSNTFPDSTQGFREAMREFWILNYTIENCRLK